jgi:alanine dehydrogenase
MTAEVPVDPSTLFLGRGEVAGLLPMGDCIAALEDAFRAQARGRTLPSGVLALHAPGGGLHVKAAGLWKGERLYLAAKLNANFPENPERRGLPTIQGLVILFDGESGSPLAVMDSVEITALRTGAATAVAARHLARPDASVLAVCGCGAQAAYQVRALAEVLPLRAVLLHDRVPDRAARLADALSGEGFPATAAPDLAAAVRGADVVVTCTPSRQPLVQLGDVAPGAFVAGVGADNPQKHELAPSLLCGSRVVVDSLDQAADIGDLHHALAAGALGRDEVHAELWELVAGLERGRGSEDEITVFDSTGVALEDVAVAALAYERARSRPSPRPGLRPR